MTSYPGIGNELTAQFHKEMDDLAQKMYESLLERDDLNNLSHRYALHRIGEPNAPDVSSETLGPKEDDYYAIQFDAIQYMIHLIMNKSYRHLQP